MMGWWLHGLLLHLFCSEYGGCFPVPSGVCYDYRYFADCDVVAGTIVVGTVVLGTVVVGAGEGVALVHCP